MRLILVFLLLTNFVSSIYAQTLDEKKLLEKSIFKATMKGFRSIECLRNGSAGLKNGSAYATMVIEFSKKGFPYNVFFFGTTECFTKFKDEIRQELLVALSTQVTLNRKEFSNAYIIVPVLLSQPQTVLPEDLGESKSWAMAYKDFEAVSFKEKHLKYIIPIEIWFQYIDIKYAIPK